MHPPPSRHQQMQDVGTQPEVIPTANVSFNEGRKYNFMRRIFRRIYPTGKTSRHSAGDSETERPPALASANSSRRRGVQEGSRAGEKSVTGTAGESTGAWLSRRRLDALQKIDDQTFSWAHIRVCLVAGVGFFADAYDVFAITLTSVILDFVYSTTYDDQAGALKIERGVSASNMLKVASPVGTSVGALLFGYLADKIGRKRTYGIELIIMIIGAFGQVFCAHGPKGTVSIYTSLFVWRLVLGVGVGGDYPQSAVYPSEFAPKRIRGRMMTAVYSSQGFGQLIAGLVSLCVIQGLKNSFPRDGDIALAQTHADHAWRIILALGCVPAAIAVYFRLTMPETPRFIMDIEQDIKQAEKDIKDFFNVSHWHWGEDSTSTPAKMPTSQLADFMSHFGKWGNLKPLLACSHASLGVNVAFYGIALNADRFFCSVGVVQSVVACSIPDGITDSAHNASAIASGILDYNVTLTLGPDSFFGPHDVFGGLTDLAAASTILAAVGVVLGYAATFALIDHPTFGRKRIQHFGFGALTLLFIIMGAVLKAYPAQDAPGVQPPAAHALFSGGGSSNALFALAVLAAFCMSCGPSATTFVLPGEQFPTRYRATCHGISAAAGKVGAIVGQFALVGNTKLKLWQSVVIFIPFMLTGMFATHALEETNGKSLEDLSKESQHNFIQGLEEELQHAV